MFLNDILGKVLSLRQLDTFHDETEFESLLQPNFRGTPMNCVHRLTQNVLLVTSRKSGSSVIDEKKKNSQNRLHRDISRLITIRDRKLNNITIL